MRSPFVPPISLIYDIYSLGRMLVYFLGRIIFQRPADNEAKVFRKYRIILSSFSEFG
jgi:hypothetical protein